MNYKTTTTIMGALLLSTSFAVAETFTILLIGPSFQPDSVVVSPGDTIRWVNVTGGVRTVTSGNPCVADGLFDGELPDYDTSFYWEVPLDASDGDIPFFCEDSCKIGMVGTITVFNDTVVRNVPADYPTIASAIAAAQSGDHIAIAAGTYYEHSLEIGEGDQVEDYDLLIIGEIGADGMPAVTIDAQQQGRVFTVDGRYDSEIRLMNLVITGGGNVAKGGGIHSGFGLKLVNCTIAGNTATSEGGGLWNSGQEDYLWGVINFINCRIMDNSAPKGGGVWMFYTFGDFFDCIISNNSADVGGGLVISHQAADLTDCVVCGNDSTDGNQIAGPWDSHGGTCLSALCSDDDGDGVPDSCLTDADGILHVPDEYDSIPSALQEAVDGNTILIAAGTYAESAYIDIAGLAITIRGEMNADGTPATIIDGTDGGGGTLGIFQCFSGEGPNTVFENLHITNGLSGLGGGMSLVNASPTVNNCVFSNNKSGAAGGAVFSNGGNPTFTHCRFFNNEANLYDGFYSIGGGAVGSFQYFSPVEGHLTFNDCVFENNVAHLGKLYSSGGGAFTIYSSSLTLNDCVISGNSGVSAGAIVYSGAFTACTLTGTTVCGNVLGGNDLVGSTQILGDWIDNGGNTVAEECPADCVEDINGDGTVSVSDLLMLIGAWGDCDGCVEDIDGSGVVDVSDLLTVIAAWGDCE